MAAAINHYTMKNLVITAACLAAFNFNACKNMQKTTANTNGALETVLSAPATVKTGNPVILTFTVKNNTRDTLTFCKWHTPFEGNGNFMASYLDIKDSNGEMARYRGIMAKRMMPPPPAAYIKVAPHHSVTASVDILKGYAVTQPGTYTVTYQAGGVSGLKQVNDVTFTVTE